MVTQYYFHGFTLSESKNYIIIPQLITNLNGFGFGFDTNGNPGYKIGGADPVIPFKSVEVFTNKTFLGTNGNTVTCNISSFYSNYQNITVDDIFVQIDFTRLRANAGSVPQDMTCTITKSYNASTGVITLTATTGNIWYFCYVNTTKGTIIITA